MGSHATTPPRPAFTLHDDEEVHLQEEHDALSPASNASHTHRPQAAFNLDLEYSDDDALLDWEQYAGMNRMRCCGLDCSRLPCARCARPPQWWFTYTKRQRRCMVGTVVGLAALLAALVALVALAAARGGRGPSDSAWHTGDPIADGLATSEELQLCQWAAFRLPRAVVPLRYNLTLDVSMEGKFPVAGEVAVDVEVRQATRCVVLHAADMEIEQVRLGGPEGAQGSVRAREEAQQVVLAFDEALPQPLAALYLTFKYNLKEGLSGFYRSTYALADGEHGSLATTQFEANSARLAFPCFDEPDFKATFNTEIIAPAHLTVLSNTPPRAVHSHEHNVEEGTRTWHFMPTPPMSTYLVCFIVGELANSGVRVVKAGTGAVNVTVWGTPDRVPDLGFAADAAAAMLPAYERALGVPYPLPKLDLVAIPDFSAGAMENWGVITYRETALLASNTSSLLDRRYVGLVVAHEMAHQWFGNLVTMGWWGELWLNEGFASYFEYVGATAAHPDSEYFGSFYGDNQPRALYFDSKRSSHPLSVEAARLNSTNAIESVFDAVMYQKGASVLRMLRAWAMRASKDLRLPTYETVPGATFEEDPFLLGLRHYLEARAYNSSTAADLWDSLADPLGFDVPRAMRQWTYQQGYPLLTVSVDDKRRVWLHQAPFGLQGAAPCDPSTAWWLPISYVTSDSPGKLRWTQLNECQSSTHLLTLKKGGKAWVKANAGQYGYYRTQYEPASLWTSLAAAARQSAGAGKGMALSGADLAGLIEDSYSLAEAGAAPITPFLDLLTALQARPPQDYEPWAAALPYLFQLERLLPCYTEWQAWVRDGLLHGYLRQAAAGAPAGNATQLLFSFTAGGASVPPEQQTVGYRMLRPAILRAAGLFGDLGIKAAAANLFTQLEGPEGAPSSAAPPNSLDPDIRDAVYQSAARTDIFEVYQRLRDMYASAATADERERTLLALGYAPGGSRIKATLTFALSDEVRAQDTRLVVVNVAANGGHAALGLTWAWLRGNSGLLLRKLGDDEEALRRLAQVAESVASLFADADKQQEVDDFFKEFEGKGVDPGYAARTKESIAANAGWVVRHGPDACEWVAAQQVAGQGGR